ncbi:hypothetical protein BDF14DRAFT_980647 [Spinellus fusiger]|nr:hypothetical protein BDF14DRAFT_980647 [Spinellus fusiger]
MDPLSARPFSVHAPIQHPAVIIHLISMTMSYFGCYPLALIQVTRLHTNRHYIVLAIGTLLALIGYIAVLWTPPTQGRMSTALALLCVYLLAVTVLHIILGVLMTTTQAQTSTQSAATAAATRSATRRRRPEMSRSFLSWKYWCSQWSGHLPSKTHLVVGWCVVLIAYYYLILATALFTESCEGPQYGQCVLPLIMGSGFLIYGTLAFLHLVSVLSLPRASTPEYYEGLILSVWGCFCLLMADIPVFETQWQAGSLGVLWLTGGLFSISISVQMWMSAIRERNIVNAIIICLTGKAIVVGTSSTDTYVTQLQSMLGYVLIVGALSRILQVIFRKSPSENLPRLVTSTSGEEVEEEDLDAPDTYSRSSHRPSSSYCKHKSVFASITIVSGLVSSLMAMAAGILMMSANPGWLAHARYYISDPATLVNLMISSSFVWATYVFFLCTVYKSTPLASHYEYIDLEEVSVASHWSEEPTHQPMTLPLDTPHDRHYTEEAKDVKRSISLPSRITHPWAVTRPEETEPPLRPSQYRAKRRSLLVQSPHLQETSTRPISSPSFGVGGVLPDLARVPIKDTYYRASWHTQGSTLSTISNSGSSISFDSSGPYMPSATERVPTDGKRTVAFLLQESQHHSMPSSGTAKGTNTTNNTNNTNNTSGTASSTTITEIPPSSLSDTETSSFSSVRKTESGKRKDRQKNKRRRVPDRTQCHDGDASNSSSSEGQKAIDYYSTERMSSNSRMC